MADLTLNDQNFKEEVLDEKSLPVVVDFWAPWCGPCKIISPVIEKLAEEFKGKIKVGKVNVDENPQVSGQFGIMSIPTIMFFKDGKVVKSMIGAQGEEAFRSQFNATLAA